MSLLLQSIVHFVNLSMLFQGLKLLGTYLSSTSASPLMRAFVLEPEDDKGPLATDVDVDMINFGDPAISVDFEVDILILILNISYLHSINIIIDFICIRLIF